MFYVLDMESFEVVDRFESKADAIAWTKRNGAENYDYVVVQDIESKDESCE